MEKMPKVLFLDDEQSILKSLKRLFLNDHLDILTSMNGVEALELMKSNDISVIVVDNMMPGMNGIEFLQRAKHVSPDSVRIMLTGHVNVEAAIRAINSGEVYKFITKPWDEAELKNIIFHSIDRHKIVQSLGKVQPDTGAQGHYPTKEEDLRRQGQENEEDIVESLAGESEGIKQVLEKVSLVAPTTMTVVLEGESGTGKELVAQLLHLKSSRRDRPFVAIDCGAIPDTLVESELFGYEKGAFTGADAQKAGKFELSNGGTLFLDEIANLPDAAQAKLLRAIQEKAVRKLGGKTDVKIDVRIIAATNINLSEAAKAGRFRSDLFYRLNEFSIRVPPLRERRGDLPLLALRFLRLAASEFKKDIGGFLPQAVETLLSYHWPGNVRELRNVVRRATLVCNSRMVGREHILIDPAGEKPNPGEFLQNVQLKDELKAGRSLSEISEERLNHAERDAILEVMKMAVGNKARAARILKISRATLYNKMKEYDIRETEVSNQFSTNVQ